MKCLEFLQQPTLQFMNSVPFPVSAQDESGVVVWVNRAFCKHFSVKSDIATGRQSATEIPEAGRSMYLDWSADWRAGRSTPGRLTIRMFDGRLLPHWVLPQPMLDASGRYVGCVLVVLDERLFGAAIANSFHEAGTLVRDVLAALARELGQAAERSGEAHVSFADLRGRVPALAALTDREWSVANRIARGDRSAVVAGDLGISVSTVRNHLKAVYRKSGLRSQSELMQRFRAWYRELDEQG